MNSLVQWDYDESVKRVSKKVKEWKAVTLKKSTLTDELARELYEARDQLSDRGSRPIWDDSQNWRTFLEEIELAKSTVHRWLEYFDPKEDRLLSDEELQERKQIEARKNQEESVAIKKRVIEAKKTGKKTADWDKKTEREYQRELKEDEERKKRVEETTEKMKREREEKEKERREKEQYYENMKIETDMLNEAADVFLNKHKERQGFKEKIRLSQTGEKDQFIDALMDYLEEMEDDNRRIEACQNIIKVCKNISVELQRKG